MRLAFHATVALIFPISLFCQDKAKEYKQGHSLHGEAFDTGPREKPWVMEGIGHTHFPITSKNPEVQKWFDQGNTLLHSFWFFEAERAFRWCLKLEPDNAMAYWGLARATEDEERGESFLREALKRKNTVTDRERMYIEAFAPLYSKEDTYQERDKKHKRLLEQICLKFPEDIEARALFGLANLGDDNHLANGLLLHQVLEKAPDHPGAHHYLIHTWNSAGGEQALDDCEQYGKIAPEIGHAQHMPGHIYSAVGMWNEAAIAMDSATRVEKRYMKQRMTFPFNNWNYAHNLNYLGYIQEQLGMPEAAIRGARQLLAAPHDPKFNNPDETVRNTHMMGNLALARVLVKYERWRDILDPKTFVWGESAFDKMYKAYCETMAHRGLLDEEKSAKSCAAHTALKDEIQKPKNKWLERVYNIQHQELDALRTLAKGETLSGLGQLTEVARKEYELQETENDPPSYPGVVYNRLGRAYLAQKSPALAVTAFDKALELVRNDGFALSGLVEAYAALGEKDKARDAMARLLFVWSDADPGNPFLERARAAGVEAQPSDNSPRKQRNYKLTSLEYLGPNVWEPYQAPQLDAVDSAGKRVNLEEYRGKNVLLIFYLGEECPHCLDQLVEAGKRNDEFSRLDTAVLAISSNTPEQNRASLKLGKVPFRLLADHDRQNARRFKSYDDFEDMELHSTILIDRQGRVHWARNGGDPFRDFDFLLKEIRRLNSI